MSESEIRVKMAIETLTTQGRVYLNLLDVIAFLLKAGYPKLAESFAELKS